LEFTPLRPIASSVREKSISKTAALQRPFAFGGKIARQTVVQAWGSRPKDGVASLAYVPAMTSKNKRSTVATQPFRRSRTTTSMRAIS